MVTTIVILSVICVLLLWACIRLSRNDKRGGMVGLDQAPLRRGLQGIIGTDVYMLGDEREYFALHGDREEILKAVRETIMNRKKE